MTTNEHYEGKGAAVCITDIFSRGQETMICNSGPRPHLSNPLPLEKLGFSMFGVLKGWFGEKLTTFGMWLHLDEHIYRRIDNIILPSKNGTTQLDHVLVSTFGIFVIETKNMQGWIFGDEKASTWCQSIYGHKNRFQNPLRQNYRHYSAPQKLDKWWRW